MWASLVRRLEGFNVLVGVLWPDSRLWLFSLSFDIRRSLLWDANLDLLILCLLGRPGVFHKEARTETGAVDRTGLVSEEVVPKLCLNVVIWTRTPKILIMFHRDVAVPASRYWNLLPQRQDGHVQVGFRLLDVFGD